MEQGHREADGSAAGGLVAGGRHRLVFDVPGQLVVEVEFVAVEVKGGGANLALREELVDLARVRVGEGDQCFLGPPQVERGLVLPHGVLEALDAAVHVRVEQGEEPAEVVLVALVRRRRHEQVMVGHPGKRLAQPVGVGLAVLAGALILWASSTMTRSQRERSRLSRASSMSETHETDVMTWSRSCQGFWP